MQRLKINDSRWQALRGALSIVGGYLLLGVLWIVFSDRVVNLSSVAPEQMQRLQTIKGLGFVIVLGLVLLWLSYAALLAVHRTRQKLQESNRKYRSLLANLPGMAYRCLEDEHWTLKFTSAGCTELTGYWPQEFVSQEITYEQLIHPDDRAEVRRQVHAAVQQGVPFCLEYRICRRDGKTRWVWERGQPLFDEQGQLSVIEGFIMDIDDRRRAQRLDAERRRFQKQAQERDQALSMVGHELRTPLAALRAISEVLITDQINPDQQRQLLENLNTQTLRMSEMINDMLESARLQSGRTQWDWSRVRVGDVCRDAMELVRPLVNTEAVRLELSVDPPDLHMLGDEATLRRVLVNLLSNANRYTSQGSISVRARAMSGEHGPQVCIEVSDTGRGIPSEKLDKLGVPFALSSSRSASDRGGTGLGLAICRQVVKVHGGTIAVRSKLGAGTTFKLTFPANQPEPLSFEEPEPIRFEQAA